MALLVWPLERNEIRRGIANNAFGYVRNGGTRPHQGWDLYAPLGTMCYAVADGKIADVGYHPDFGNFVLLKFHHRGQTLYAAYCHLSVPAVFAGDGVKAGDRIGLTGDSGNAKNPNGDEQHLHFEIRTQLAVGRGLGVRIDPAQLYGRAPLGWTFFEGHGQKLNASGATGLKVRGVNVRVREEW